MLKYKGEKLHGNTINNIEKLWSHYYRTILSRVEKILRTKIIRILGGLHRQKIKKIYESGVESI